MKLSLDNSKIAELILSMDVTRSPKLTLKEALNKLCGKLTAEYKVPESELKLYLFDITRLFAQVYYGRDAMVYQDRNGRVYVHKYIYES